MEAPIEQQRTGCFTAFLLLGTLSSTIAFFLALKVPEHFGSADEALLTFASAAVSLIVFVGLWLWQRWAVTAWMVLSPVVISARALNAPNSDAGLVGWFGGMAMWAAVYFFAIRPNWRKFDGSPAGPNSERDCPQCQRISPAITTFCECGHSFTGEPDRLDAALQRRGHEGTKPRAAITHSPPASTPEASCRECGTVNRSGASFCRTCGTSLREPECPRCRPGCRWAPAFVTRAVPRSPKLSPPAQSGAPPRGPVGSSQSSKARGWRMVRARIPVMHRPREVAGVVMRPTNGSRACPRGR